MNDFDCKRMLKSIFVVLYIIVFMLTLRYDVSLLKIQSEWYRDETEWKYHEWEISSMTVSGETQKIYEAYPSYEYAVVPYSTKANFEPIIIKDNEWIKRGMTSCKVSIALGNITIYSEELPITNGTITITGLEPIWNYGRQIYYGYYILYAGILLIGSFGVIKEAKRKREAIKKSICCVLSYVNERKRQIGVWTGIFAGYILISFFYLKSGNYFERTQLFLPKLEQCVYIGAVIVLYFVNVFLLKSRKQALVTTCLVAIPVFFSLHGVTLFQSHDEENNIKEQMWLSIDTFRHWSFGNARTNYLVMGTIWKLIPKKYAMVGVYPIFMNAFQFSKVVHWCCGYGVSLGVITYIYKRLLCTEHSIRENIFLVLFYYGVFTLPVWNIAMKNYNYDLFSLLFCIFGIVMCIDYLVCNKGLCKIFGLLFMGIAVQEKVTTIVYYLIVMVVMLANDIIKEGTKQKEKIFLNSIVMFLLPFVPIIITDTWVSIWLCGGYRAQDSAINSIRIISSCFEYMMDMFGVSMNGFAVLGVVYLLILAGSIFCALVWKMVGASLKKDSNVIGTMALFLVSFLIINFGAIWYKKIEFQENSIWANDGISLLMETIYGYISYVPTIYVVSCICLLLFFIIKRNDIVLSLKEKILGMASAVVLGGVTWINVIACCLQNKKVMVGRYQNIQQLVNVICILLLLSIVLKFREVLIGTFICAGAFMETVSSAPGYTIFYPFWRTEIYNEGYLIGEEWGVGNGIAGEMIEEYCKAHDISFKGANIYSTNITPWGDNNYELNCQKLKNAVKDRTCEWDDNDFYVVFANSIADNNVQVVIPDEITPVMSAEYRNVEWLWIYQGSQLKDCYPFDEW